MPRAVFVCITIVAAFQLHLAAAPASVEDLPVAPQVSALAARLDVELSRDRWRFMADMARALYAAPDSKPPTFAAIRPAAGAAEPGEPPPRVPVPLPASLWSTAVFRRTVPADQLIATILADRRAALLCRGLSAVDDETLDYLVDHPALVSFLYERAAGIFSAFGEHLHIRDSRVVMPGGDEAASLWESVALAPLSDPDQFARALFGGFEGRLAYLAGAIESANPAAARFALGLWIADPAERASRFKVLLDECMRGYREWRPGTHPFARPLGDLAMLLLRIRVEPSGAPGAPAGRAFWGAVMGVNPGLTRPAGAATAEKIDAAWLIGAMAGEDMYSRTERLDQFSFGQRVFVGVDEAPDGPAATALRPFRRTRMLLLTLERLGARRPEVYAASMARAASLGDVKGSRQFWVIGQYQGALDLVARMRRSGTIDRARAEALAASLAAVPLRGDEYGGGIAQWLRTQLSRDLASTESNSWESRMTEALAGPSDPEAQPRLFWEGQDYRLDLAFAERQRIQTIRRKQGGHTLDMALAIDDVARTLNRDDLMLDDVRDARQTIERLADESAPGLRRPPVVLMPPGVLSSRDGLAWLAEAATDLSRIVRPSDLRRAARVGNSLQQLADVVLGNALISFVYAAAMGDPEGAALLAGNVALRHDFGFARRDGDMRLRMLWAQPRQDFQPGVPWHVGGSLLGLDVALAPLALRRLVVDGMLEAPKVSSIEREGLAVGVALLDPLRMTDGDREAIVEAIASGRSRVAGLLGGVESADALADALAMDGRRRRSLTWLLQTDPAAVPDQFSLADLLVLGGGAPTADLDAWGTPGLISYGCLCTRFPTRPAWRVLEGRSQLPVMAATMSDLTLATAVMLRDLQVPAALVRSVLTVTLLDLIDDLAASSGHWWSFSHQAQRLSRRQVEDYVSSSAAVDGPLVPEEDSEASREH